MGTVVAAAAAEGSTVGNERSHSSRAVYFGSLHAPLPAEPKPGLLSKAIVPRSRVVTTDTDSVDTAAAAAWACASCCCC